jgi:hypothetical protein
VSVPADAPAVAGAKRPPRRIKSTLILASALLGVVALVSWTQAWFDVTLVADSARLEVAGEVAAPALSALALTTVVLVGAVSIAGPFFRVVLGVLEVFIAVAIVYSGVLAVSDPVSAAAPRISEATGVGGERSIAALVASIEVGPWPWVAIASGVLIGLAGVAIVVTGRSWPGSPSRKYSATRLEPVAAERTSVDDWDALSGGEDPTSRP